MKKIGLWFSVTILFCLLVVPAQAQEWSWKKAAEPYQGQTVYILVNFHPDIEATLPIYKQFEEETGIKVQFDLLVRRQMDIKAETELAAETGAYDLMHMGLWKTARYARRNWAEPLQKYINDPSLTGPDFDLDDFVYNALRSLTDKDGQILGLPWSTETGLIYYRTDLYEKYGIPGPPTTFAEMEDICKKVYTKDIPSIALRSVRGYGINMWSFGRYGGSFGGSYFDDSMHPTVNTEEWIKATTFYAGLNDNYGPSGVGAYKHYELVQDFAQGQLVMIEDAGPWGKTFNDSEKSKVVGKWKAAMLTKGPVKHQFSHYTHGLMIPRVAQHKEAAWLFLQYMTSKEFQLKRALLFGGGSVTRTSTLEDPRYAITFDFGDWGGINAASLKIASAVENPYFVPYNLPEYKEIGDTLGIALQNIITGDKTPQKALDSANEVILGILQEAGYVGKPSSQFGF